MLGLRTERRIVLLHAVRAIRRLVGERAERLVFMTVAWLANRLMLRASQNDSQCQRHERGLMSLPVLVAFVSLTGVR